MYSLSLQYHLYVLLVFHTIQIGSLISLINQLILKLEKITRLFGLDQ